MPTTHKSLPSPEPVPDLNPFRVGSVPYLNAAPLTYGLEDQIRMLPPAQLAAALHAGELDAALVSITEVIADPGYVALDPFAIVSRGPVYSVILVHRDPLDQIRTVHLDPASRTSVQLVRILLRRMGITPEWKPLTDYNAAEQHQNVLLIGNPAIEFRRRNPNAPFWDLGAAWADTMQLPFVYAVWAIREDLANSSLPGLLHTAGLQGQAHLNFIRQNHPDFDPGFRTAYLGGHVQYNLDSDAKTGVERFRQEMQTPDTYPVRWIQGG